MIERQILGEYSLKIDGFDTSKLAERICRECKVISIYRRDDTLFLTVYGKSFRKVKELVEQENAVMEIIGRRGIIFILRKYFRRYGIFAGVILIAAAVFLLSNFAMKIEVNGASDEVIRREILGILSEEGLKPGCFIPSQDFCSFQTPFFPALTAYHGPLSDIPARSSPSTSAWSPRNPTQIQTGYRAA